MRKGYIVGSILTFLGLAAVIGVHVFASCLLAIGIVASYGLSVRALLSRRVGQYVASTLASITVALVALTLGAGLVSLWATVLEYPFLSGLTVWSAIFGGGATWALIATWCEEHGHSPKALRAIVIPQ